MTDLSTYLYRLSEPGATIYTVLGVDTATSPDQLKKLVKKAGLVMHPDKGGSTSGFQALGNLLDKSLKKKAEPVVLKPKKQPVVVIDVEEFIREQINTNASVIYADKANRYYYWTPDRVRIPESLLKTVHKAKGITVLFTNKGMALIVSKEVLEEGDSLSDYIDWNDLEYEKQENFLEEYKKFRKEFNDADEIIYEDEDLEPTTI